MTTLVVLCQAMGPNEVELDRIIDQLIDELGHGVVDSFETQLSQPKQVRVSCHTV